DSEGEIAVTRCRQRRDRRGLGRGPVGKIAGRQTQRGLGILVLGSGGTDPTIGHNAIKAIEAGGGWVIRKCELDGGGAACENADTVAAVMGSSIHQNVDLVFTDPRGEVVFTGLPAASPGRSEEH